MEIKDYRESKGLTISRASQITGVPVRTYIRYENDENYGDSLKRSTILHMLKEKCDITEEKGLLSLEYIQNTVFSILKNYKDKVTLCYLFGSYAKGYAKENSDVDLCVATSLTGLEFVELIENLRTGLCKRVDLLRLSDVATNIELLQDIMKDGIKIYG